MADTRFYHELVKAFPTMEGKRVVITGCTSGTGFVLAKTCAQLGAVVCMLNRPSERACDALRRVQSEGNSSAVSIDCDLQDFASVRRAGQELRSLLREVGIDVLCNNAGVMGLPDRATVDGYDVQIQTNHLSHFLLTHELWPLLERAAELRGEARVINHSSGARKMGNRTIGAEYFERNGGHLGGDRFPGVQKWVRYQQSKLANLLFTYALHDRRPAGTSQKIRALAAHPGPTDSGLQAKTIQAGGSGLFDRYVIRRTLRVAQSVEDGTAGIARCACEHDVESGAFYGPTGRGSPGPAMLLEPERDIKAEMLLWDLSLKATGIDAYFSA